MEHEPQKQNGALVQKALKSSYAEWFLGILSFLESAFLPIIIDPILVVLTLAAPNRWLRYSLFASAFSVLGGVLAYVIGAFFFELVGAELVDILNFEEQFAQAETLLRDNVFLMTLVGAFTPIPYKIFGIAGGVLYVNIWLFILASIVGRFARFLLVGFVTKQFGPEFLRPLTRRLNVATAVVCVGLALYLLMSVV